MEPPIVAAEGTSIDLIGARGDAENGPLVDLLDIVPTTWLETEESHAPFAMGRCRSGDGGGDPFNFAGGNVLVVLPTRHI